MYRTDDQLCIHSIFDWLQLPVWRLQKEIEPTDKHHEKDLHFHVHQHTASSSLSQHCHLVRQIWWEDNQRISRSYKLRSDGEPISVHQVYHLADVHLERVLASRPSTQVLCLGGEVAPWLKTQGVSSEAAIQGRVRVWSRLPSELFTCDLPELPDLQHHRANDSNVCLPLLLHQICCGQVQSYFRVL